MGKVLHCALLVAALGAILLQCARSEAQSEIGVVRKDPLGRPRKISPDSAAHDNHHRIRCDDANLLRHPTYAGYLEVNGSAGSFMYYAYYEAQRTLNKERTPILLWLQGGPGCASTFGSLYELGPDIIDDTGRHSRKPRVVRNPGSWNKIFGLLVIDQPIGTGYSLVGKDRVPEDELTLADQLYRVLRGFFHKYCHLQSRPFFITGESYGGKYVPSIAHYILQAQAQNSKAGTASFRVTRELPEDVPAPNFNLSGIAIGNSWVEPAAQTLQIPDVAFRFGLVAHSGKQLLRNLTEEVLGLVDAGEWREAHRKRSHMITVLEEMSGLGTLLDIRRTAPYDASFSVDSLLNCWQARERLHADRHVRYESCSAKVDDAMSSDVMRSVADLFPDILDLVPVLLYQGQFDGQDGPSSNEAWIRDLDWEGVDAFLDMNTSLWQDEHGEVLGWYKLQRNLSQVVVRNSGHLVPHDQPIAALHMITGWVYLTLTGDSSGLGPLSDTQLNLMMAPLVEAEVDDERGGEQLQHGGSTRLGCDGEEGNEQDADKDGDDTDADKDRDDTDADKDGDDDADDDHDELSEQPEKPEQPEHGPQHRKYGAPVVL